MKPKIFIIEDEAGIIELYKLAFEENGLKLEGVMTGNAGLEKLKVFAKKKALRPDLILLDLLLPDISGVEILKEFKKMDEIKDIPLIILTNYGSGQIQRLTEDENLKDIPYFIKIEITPQQLVEIVKKKLNIQS
ncbi:MAG: response regulator [Patescibacteria group bacterium]